MFFPIAAAVLQAVSFTLDKVILSIKKVTYKTYNGISFPLIFLFTLIIFFIIRPEINPAMFDKKYILLIVASATIGIVTNIFFYRALKSDLLSEMEVVSLIGGVPLIVFASLFFADERNYLVVLLALFSVVALVWSHWEKHHFHIAKKTWPFLIWALAVSPFRGVISKSLLLTWSPIMIQLVLDGLIAIVFLPIYFKDAKKVPAKAIGFLLLTNLLTTVAWILYLYSYQLSGIVYTVLIFTLQPLIVYFTSVFFLKEKVHAKKAIAFLLIVAAIGIAQVWG